MPGTIYRGNQGTFTPEEKMWRKLNGVLCSMVNEEAEETEETDGPAPRVNTPGEFNSSKAVRVNSDIFYSNKCNIHEENMSLKLQEVLHKMDTPSALSKNENSSSGNTKKNSSANKAVHRRKINLQLKETASLLAGAFYSQINNLRYRVYELKDFINENSSESEVPEVQGGALRQGQEDAAGSAGDKSSGDGKVETPVFNSLKKAGRIAGNVVFVVMILFAASLLFFLIQSRVTGGEPAIFNHHINVVEGGSMSPTFEAGSLAIVRPTDPGNIEAGDIITYSSPGENEDLTTHRVMEVNKEGEGLSFTTRGDANTTNDARPVTPEQIQGRMVTSIPYGGHVLNFVFTGPGLLILVALPALAVIAMELKYIFRYYSQIEKSTAGKGISAGESQS